MISELEIADDNPTGRVHDLPDYSFFPNPHSYGLNLRSWKLFELCDSQALKKFDHWIESLECVAENDFIMAMNPSKIRNMEEIIYSYCYQLTVEFSKRDPLERRNEYMILLLPAARLRVLYHRLVPAFDCGSIRSFAEWLDEHLRWRVKVWTGGIEKTMVQRPLHLRTLIDPEKQLFHYDAWLHSIPIISSIPRVDLLLWLGFR